MWPITVYQFSNWVVQPRKIRFPTMCIWIFRSKGTANSGGKNWEKIKAAIGTSDSKKHKLNKLRNKLIKKAFSVLWTVLEPLELIVQRRTLHKLMNIKDNTAHHLHNIWLTQQSVHSQRLLQLRYNTEWYSSNNHTQWQLMTINERKKLKHCNFPLRLTKFFFFHFIKFQEFIVRIFFFSFG